VERSNEPEIAIDIAGLPSESYDDDANILALPSKKRRTITAADNAPIVKKLSKKQRKLLEKVVDQKNKKAKHADLLASLQQFQASPQELALLTSTTDVYSGKLKRTNPGSRGESAELNAIKLNSITGCGKRMRRDEPMDEDSSSSNTEDEETDESDEEQSEEEAETATVDEDQEAEVQPEKKIKIDPVPTLETTSLPSSEIKVDVQPTPAKPTRPTVNIPVNRTQEIQTARLGLPILGEEQIIMEMISEHPVVVMCGETGCGKTTQVPQFLYEAGYAHGDGIIGVTEPRRVAAVSMSRRVAEEMALSTREVSYQIRYEGNVSPDTRVAFMTDGILLKEVQNDFLLNRYSVIILDEAHERSVYTDLLLGLLSRIVPLRHKKGRPLKVIIMSATLRIEDFTENRRLFPSPPPVIRVDSRQYSVAVHFNKRTPIENEYMGEAFKKVCKIHRKLPTGGILVFVTGQQEIHTLCAKLRRTFPTDANKQHKDKANQNTDDGEEDDVSSLPRVSLDDYSVMPQDEEAEHRGDEEEGDALAARHNDDELDSDDEGWTGGNEQPLHVLPLYSLLSTDKQQKVFKPPPEGCRLCVVATNVAETSLTIPNIKYVIDTGKVKTKFYDKVTGVSTFKVTWTSKASANQRSGRAGRTGPGHSYRLYSSAVFNDEFEEFSAPEITRRPVEDLILQMKDIGIERTANFPFPTPPATEALKAAEELLVSLGALDPPPVLPKQKKKNAKEGCSSITPVGHVMACFPVSPRYGKMLALGHQHGLLPYAVAIVAALSVQELLTTHIPHATSPEQKETVKAQALKLAAVRRVWAGAGHCKLLGDLSVLLHAVGAAEYAGCTHEFCTQNGIRYKGMMEVRKLRSQLTNAVNGVLPDAGLVLDPRLSPPTDTQAKLLRQVILSGLGDHVARRMPDITATIEQDKDKIQKLKNAYQGVLLDDPIFVHPASVLYKQNVQFVVYQHLEETSKLYMKGVVGVEPEWLAVYLPHTCRFSKPQDEPPPRYDRSAGRVVCHLTATFGPHYWPLPAVELEYPAGLDRYKWFARALLEGSVCPKLKRFTVNLLSTPATMIKTWANLQPRTEILLKELLKQQACDKQSLQKALNKDKSYLCAAYCSWLPQSYHIDVEKLWPSLFSTS